jgi:hypothetical protein
MPVITATNGLSVLCLARWLLYDSRINSLARRNKASDGVDAAAEHCVFGRTQFDLDHLLDAVFAYDARRLEIDHRGSAQACAARRP